MEDMLIQSANMEIALWQNFGTGRTANATALLAIVVAVWVAARFSSVSLEKNVNLLGKIFVTAFAVGVFMMGLVVYGNIGGTFEGHAGPCFVRLGTRRVQDRRYVSSFTNVLAR